MLCHSVLGKFFVSEAFRSSESTSDALAFIYQWTARESPSETTRSGNVSTLGARSKIASSLPVVVEGRSGSRMQWDGANVDRTRPVRCEDKFFLSLHCPSRIEGARNICREDTVHQNLPRLREKCSRHRMVIRRERQPPSGHPLCSFKLQAQALVTLDLALPF